MNSQDGSRRQIVAYSFGTIESGFANQFFNLLNGILLIALKMDPIVIGFILALNMLVSGICDPIMAQWTDNARTRWGRRRPFILVGSLVRIALTLLIVSFFPRDDGIKTNAAFAQERVARETAAAQVAAAPAEQAAPGQVAPTPTPKPAAPIGPKLSFFETLSKGFSAFTSTENSYHHSVAIFLLVSGILFASAGAMMSVPYYALGIELCPSYDGRTRVVTYRSMADKFVGLLVQWTLPFCFLPIFPTVLDGLFWYGIIFASISIPATLYMVSTVREPLAAVAQREKAAHPKGPGIFRSMWLTAKNIHFLKILFLYQCISFTLGIFVQVGLLLTIFWVFNGDALAGATINSYAGTLSTVLAIAVLPLVNWACRRLQKHRALQIAIIWMSVGTALKWVLVTPEHPYWQLALPFFFAVGISGVFTILPTMMADVTDIDEWRNGTRREGMFGAVMGFLMKVTSAIQPILAGVVLVVAGYDASLGTHQSPETIFNMRLMFSFIPAGLLLLALIALWRYPLTREYMEDIQEKLRQRREAAGVS